MTVQPRRINDFKEDVIWNMGALFIMGASGVIFNIIIAFFYDISALGVFNQVFAVYIFVSQFAVLGIHLSALKYVAEHTGDSEKCGHIIIAALIMSAAVAALVSIGLWYTGKYIGGILSSARVAEGVVWAAPGVFFFAVNKVLLAVLNGFRRMKLFAVFQAMRYLIIIAVLLAAGVLGFSAEKLPASLSISEILLFACLMVSIRGDFTMPEMSTLKDWLAKHLNFGAQGFMSGVLFELNTKIDILMLGYFLSDKIVGIYSFAATIAEGIYQIPIVLRSNFNPIIVRLIAEQKLNELKAMAEKGVHFTYKSMVLIGVLASCLYPIGVSLVTNKADLTYGWPVFVILMAGIVLSAGYIPFGNILLQAGKPALHTFMITAVVIFNIVGNFLLIPLWGAYGAAFATAASFVASVFLLKQITKKSVGVAI